MSIISLMLGHSLIRNIEFWTSATQIECKGKLRWCSLNKRFARRNVTWAPEDGDCLSIQFTNTTSTMAKTDCDKQLNFICEVVKVLVPTERNLIYFFMQSHYTGNHSDSLQNECMQVWNITFGIN
jgi:hypothetical protein